MVSNHVHAHCFQFVTKLLFVILSSNWNSSGEQAGTSKRKNILTVYQQKVLWFCFLKQFDTKCWKYLYGKYYCQELYQTTEWNTLRINVINLFAAVTSTNNHYFSSKVNGSWQKMLAADLHTRQGTSLLMAEHKEKQMRCIEKTFSQQGKVEGNSWAQHKGICHYYVFPTTDRNSWFKTITIPGKVSHFLWSPCKEIKTHMPNHGPFVCLLSTQ